MIVTIHLEPIAQLQASTCRQSFHLGPGTYKPAVRLILPDDVWFDHLGELFILVIENISSKNIACL